MDALPKAMSQQWNVKMRRFERRIDELARSIIGTQRKVRLGNGFNFAGNVVACTAKVVEDVPGQRAHALYEIMLEGPTGHRKTYVTRG